MAIPGPEWVVGTPALGARTRYRGDLRAMSRDPSAFRLLPSVDELLGALGPAEAVMAREVQVEHARAALEHWRGAIRAGEYDAAGLAARLARGDLAQDLRARLQRETRRGVVPALNATGVVLHTGLGRAPLHPEAAARQAAVSAGYCVLELDRESGERNERDGRVSELAARLTGAEAALAVNNNAAATYLVLSTFAWGGREVIVSRGELVEIGGSFRMPDVMARAAVTLREVGTTNRTRIGDYRAAVGERTGLLLKVHTSNYRVEGFTEDVTPSQLAELGRELGLTSAYDLGSGLLEVAGARPLDMLGGEPTVAEAVASGLDLVTFSGDKLLGGPQAGLIVGRREALATVRKNPIYRAVRLDKAALAGLEATLELYLAGRADELPARRMLLATRAELAPRAADLAKQLSKLPGVTATAQEAQSQPGSGSAPGIFLDTQAVRLTHESLSPSTLSQRLRRGDPPVFVRIHEDALWLDPRTLEPADDPRLVAAVRAALGERRG
jgi:L-seryl-tRNA(Ser) seleniumtransferase